MGQFTKEQQRERRIKRKQVFKRWLKKYRKDINMWGCIAYGFFNIIIVNIILYINNPELFQWYLKLFLI